MQVCKNQFCISTLKPTQLKSCKFPDLLLSREPFIYYVSTFFGFLDTLPPYVSKHVYVLKISKNCKFSNPTSAYVLYEWSLGQDNQNVEMADNRSNWSSLRPGRVGKKFKLFINLTSILLLSRLSPNFLEAYNCPICWLTGFLPESFCPKFYLYFVFLRYLLTFFFMQNFPLFGF